jgi:glutathione peroxidase
MLASEIVGTAPATDALYDIELTAIDGSRLRMDEYRGRTLLIVNVASRCGYTPQYAGLEALYRKYESRGLTVLAFPCDQFGHQEPGTDAEIQEFCSEAYDVTFPVFSKIKVNGGDAHPLFVYLKSRKKGLLGSEAIKWNFTKFLVGPSGTVVKRYGPGSAPEAIDPDVAALLLPAMVGHSVP